MVCIQIYSSHARRSSGPMAEAHVICRESRTLDRQSVPCSIRSMRDRDGPQIARLARLTGGYGDSRETFSLVTEFQFAAKWKAPRSSVIVRKRDCRCLWLSPVHSQPGMLLMISTSIPARGPFAVRSRPLLTSRTSRSSDSCTTSSKLDRPPWSMRWIRPALDFVTCFHLLWIDTKNRRKRDRLIWKLNAFTQALFTWPVS